MSRSAKARPSGPIVRTGRPYVSGKTTGRKGLLTFDRNILDSESFRAGNIRNADGRVVQYNKKPNREMQEANYRLAKAAIHLIVQALERKIADHERAQRETVDSGPLFSALESPQNIAYDAEGFTVVIDSAMDESAAGKYYRNLEYGSDVFVGRVIEGFFIGSDGRPGGPKPGEKSAVRLVQVGDFRNLGRTSKIAQVKGREGRINPAGRFHESVSDSYTDSSGRSSPLRFTESARTKGRFPVASSGRDSEGFVSSGGKGVPIIIRNPIPRYAYIETGIEDFVESGEILRQYRIALATFEERGGLAFDKGYKL